jgi:putative phosphoribosyl transferase
MKNKNSRSRLRYVFRKWHWLVQNRAAGSNLNIGYFGASTRGAAAALAAAAKRVDIIKAVVSRGRRPGMADQYLGQVEAPTLLNVGG